MKDNEWFAHDQHPKLWNAHGDLEMLSLAGTIITSSCLLEPLWPSLTTSRLAAIFGNYPTL
jgi:hypothetical protein